MRTGKSASPVESAIRKGERTGRWAIGDGMVAVAA